MNNKTIMNNKTMRRVIALPIFVGIILLSFATMGMDGITKVAKLKPLKAVPVVYADKHMPKGWWTDPKIIKEGEEIFHKKSVIPCALCHGADGVPKLKGVRDLRSVRMNRMSDSYWFWRISEGVPNTAMPSFKVFLTEEERWKVIAYAHQFSHGGKAEEHNHPEIEWWQSEEAS